MKDLMSDKSGKAAQVDHIKSELRKHEKEMRLANQQPPACPAFPSGHGASEPAA